MEITSSYGCPLGQGDDCRDVTPLQVTTAKLLKVMNEVRETPLSLIHTLNSYAALFEDDETKTVTFHGVTTVTEGGKAKVLETIQYLEGLDNNVLLAFT